MQTRLNHRYWVALLLALYATLAVSSIWNKSPTFDEPDFILGGINSLTLSDYRINYGNGILPQKIQGAPAVIAGGYVAPYDQLPAYKTNDTVATIQHVFFSPGINYDRIFFLARLTNIALGVALGLAIYYFARRLYGRRAGLLALALYALTPTVIAHSSLATADLAAALFFTLSTGTLWLFLQKATLPRLILLCIFVSALFVTKFSCVLFVPLGLAIIAASILLRPQWRLRLPGAHIILRGKLPRALVALSFFALVGLVAWLTIWACFSFRYEGANPALGEGVFQTPAQWEKSQALLSPARARLIQFLRDHKLFPEVWVYGLAHTLNYSVQRPTYFLGNLSNKGQPAYFPVAWAIKTPPALILLQLSALAAGLWTWVQLTRHRNRRKLFTRLHALAPWWLFLFIVGAACLTASLNIGIRHILPLIPATLILTGSLARFFRPPPDLLPQGAPLPASDQTPLPAWRKNLPATAILALVLLTFLDTLLAWPNYLAYYSPLIGGNTQGYKYLSDSNTDWGQDLPALKDFAQSRRLSAIADDNPGPDGVPTRLYFSYMGLVPLPLAGIDCNPLNCFPYAAQNLDLKSPHLPGYYAFGASQLARLYPPFPTWDQNTEKLYSHLTVTLRLLDSAAPDSPQAAQALESLGQPQDTARRNLRFLRSLRLAFFLARIEPDYQINGSINIYCLDQPKLDQYLFGDPP
jgi:4-amino-4-deoxy-L-arabinose transferase-like glycosyltransferase